MKYIISYLVGFFTFIGDLFKTIGSVIVKVVLIIVACGEFLFSVLGALPAMIKIVAVGIVIVCIIYKILGREGGEAS